MVESHHPTDVNIFGMQGCKTPSGDLCNACCGPVYAIHHGEKLFKRRGETCRFSQKTGCNLHSSPEQPKVCAEFHCSRKVRAVTNPLLPESVKIITLKEIGLFLKIAMQNGLITREQAESHWDHWRSFKNVTYQPSVTE